MNEQQIGTIVFGRDPDYDPTIDSIVRSHATRLRQKLREYFEVEGIAEPFILTIPKGGYIPRMEPRAAAITSQEPIAVDIVAEVATPPTVTYPLSASLISAPQDDAARRTIRRWQWTAALCAVVALIASVLLWRDLAKSPRRPVHPFWTSFLGTHGGQTILVESDSGLVMYQHLTGRAVSLGDYVNDAYWKDTPISTPEGAIAAHLAVKRYTPVLDTATYQHLSAYLDAPAERLTTRFARDLRMDELKSGNALLMGSHESDPWVSLFEPSMNFLFQGDLKGGLAKIINRHPRPGEQAEYTMVEGDPEHTVYGLVSYRPNLTHTGDVVIVEGQTVAGTQTSLDFLFNDSQFLPFLKAIRKGSGGIPHFEVLLRSGSVAGQSSKIEVVASRVESD